MTTKPSPTVIQTMNILGPCCLLMVVFVGAVPCVDAFLVAPASHCNKRPSVLFKTAHSPTSTLPSITKSGLSLAPLSQFHQSWYHNYPEQSLSVKRQSSMKFHLLQRDDINDKKTDDDEDDNKDFFSRIIAGGTTTTRGRTTSIRNNNKVTESQPQLSSSGRASTILLQAETVLAPAAKVLQETTGGWALSYADLTPESEQTPIGQAFLATNIAYATAGAVLSIQGEPLLAFMLELVSAASFAYHYTQLAEPYNRTTESTVQLALTIDYILAFSSIALGLVYLISDQTLPPIEGVASSTIGIACLLACWKWEQGIPYIVLHSCWHLMSAISAYIVGSTHLAA